jgi:hypothetical protein
MKRSGLSIQLPDTAAMSGIALPKIQEQSKEAKTAKCGINDPAF